jgi:hypothetical protein
MVDDPKDKRPVNAGIDDTVTNHGVTETNGDSGKETPFKPPYTGFCGSSSFGFPQGKEGSDPLPAPDREEYMSKEQLRRYNH